MPKPTGPTNLALKQLAEEIHSRGYKENNSFLKNLAKRLGKPTRRRASVNLSTLNRNVKEGETAVVPGKVLSSGILNKKITVAAWSFSDPARSRIEKSGGKAITITELVKKNPKGTKVRIIA